MLANNSKGQMKKHSFAFTGLIKCDECGWLGTEKQLVSVPIPKNPFSIEIHPDTALDAAKQISEQYFLLMSKVAGPVIGQCIVQAGLVGRKDVKNLAKLIRAACLGAHKATLDEANKISKDYQAGNLPS